MRRLIFILLMWYLTPCVAQGIKTSREVVTDPLFFIEFDSTSNALTNRGMEELARIKLFFKEKHHIEEYEILLAEQSSSLEIRADKFIGLKRCKIVLDTLVSRFDIPADVIKIDGNNFSSTNDRRIGVRYRIRDRCKANELTREEEEKYFKQKQ